MITNVPAMDRVPIRVRDDLAAGWQRSRKGVRTPRGPTGADWRPSRREGWRAVRSQRVISEERLVAQYGPVEAMIACRGNAPATAMGIARRRSVRARVAPALWNTESPWSVSPASNRHPHRRIVPTERSRSSARGRRSTDACPRSHSGRSGQANALDRRWSWVWGSGARARDRIDGLRPGLPGGGMTRMVPSAGGASGSRIDAFSNDNAPRLSRSRLLRQL